MTLSPLMQHLDPPLDEVVQRPVGLHQCHTPHDEVSEGTVQMSCLELIDLCPRHEGAEQMSPNECLKSRPAPDRAVQNHQPVELWPQVSLLSQAALCLCPSVSALRPLIADWRNGSNCLVAVASESWVICHCNDCEICLSPWHRGHGNLACHRGHGNLARNLLPTPVHVHVLRPILCPVHVVVPNLCGPLAHTFCFPSGGSDSPAVGETHV
jgi:hypothetical protein